MEQILLQPTHHHQMSGRGQAFQTRSPFILIPRFVTLQHWTLQRSHLASVCLMHTAPKSFFPYRTIANCMSATSGPNGKRSRSSPASWTVLPFGSCPICSSSLLCCRPSVLSLHVSHLITLAFLIMNLGNGIIHNAPLHCRTLHVVTIWRTVLQFRNLM